MSTGTVLIDNFNGECQTEPSPLTLAEKKRKLVELIYSAEGKLLAQFVHETDASDASNGHAVAAHRIVSEYCKLLDKSANELGNLSVEKVQSVAKILFEKSSLQLITH